MLNLKKKSYMRKQGKGYVVVHWSDDYNAWVESHEMAYHTARAALGTANYPIGYGCGKITHCHMPFDKGFGK